jgi:hypothetical protein
VKKILSCCCSAFICRDTFVVTIYKDKDFESYFKNLEIVLSSGKIRLH